MADIESYNILNREQKKMIFAGMSDAVVTFNENAEITYANPAAKKIFYAGREIDERFIRILHEKTKQNKAFREYLIKCLEDAESLEKTVVAYYNGEKKLYLEINSCHVRTDGEFSGIMLIARDVTPEVDLKKQQHDFALIFSGLITCLTIYLYLWTYFRFTIKLAVSKSVYTHMIEGIAFLLFLEIIFFTSFSPKDIGFIVKPKKIIQSVGYAFFASLIIDCLLVMANVLIRAYGTPFKSYFIGGSFEAFFYYFFTALVQEFLARGVMQNTVKNIMKVKGGRVGSVIVSALLFSLMHIPFGSTFMVGAFLLSIILGTVYEIQKNLWGCIVLHWLVGYMAMALFF